VGALLFGRKAESYWATVWQKRMRMVAVLPRSILPHLTEAALPFGRAAGPAGVTPSPVPPATGAAGTGLTKRRRPRRPGRSPWPGPGHAPCPGAGGPRTHPG